MAKGPRRGGAPNSPFAPAGGGHPARQGKRPTAQPGTIPTYYIIILNHRQTLCFQPNPLHRQNGKVRIHLHAVRHGIPQPHGHTPDRSCPQARSNRHRAAVCSKTWLPAPRRATMPFSVPKCLSPRSETASGNSATSSSDMVTFLHSTQSLGIPGPSSKPSNRLSPRTFSRANEV